MIVSVETPVFKGRWLRAAIDSVLQQTSPHWEFSLFWDGGDESSRRILEELQSENHPRVHVHFSENRGIAHARRFLTEHSRGEYLLPLDDDDRLPPNAIERFVEYVTERPWCGIVRARRGFIDEAGNAVQQNPWFPFERRHFQRGMVTDVFNHSQPYLIQRAAYDRTSGWEGFDDFLSAGADCDIFLKIEEVAPVELLDEVLYLYRINPDRASLALTDAAAFEMWRRLADKTIERLGLPLERTNDQQPFAYRSLPRPTPNLDMVDFILAPTPNAEASTRARKRLGDLGVVKDAIHVTEATDDVSTICGAASSRPLVCLLSAHVVPSRDCLDLLFSVLHRQQADVVGPKILSQAGALCSVKPFFDSDRLPRITDEGQPDHGRFNGIAQAAWLPTTMMLARREVIRAAGDWNTCWQHPRLQAAELCLRARARNFKCVMVGTTTAMDHGKASESFLSQEAELFPKRWRDYSDLFDSLEVADLAALLSMKVPGA